MRLDDLDLSELLSFDPKEGAIRFAGRRALILDAVALGLLRKELIETLGIGAARAVLARFGFAHGWRTAEGLREEIPWEDEGDWRRAAGRLHALLGLVRVEPVPPHDDRERPFTEALWFDSYEAEQHLLHHGRSDVPVCWTLTGFAAGYLSFANRRTVAVQEETCVGKGDAVCRVVGLLQPDPALADGHALERAPLDASLARVAETLKRAERSLARRARVRARAEGPEDPQGFVVRSEAMRRVVEVARRVAKVDSTVLITGESGVGKERIAALVHQESARAAGPFVPVDCGAMAETLLDSELFGHARGSFTGATHDRTGLFEAANHGTLFLDEVGEMSLGMQGKLLRALQELEIRRIGETRPRPVDVRVVAATNRDLDAEAKAGRFRRDLLYRLKVVGIRVPPLRERPEDVLPLAREILGRIAGRLGKPVQALSPRAADRLQRHAWPGNVRELENALEHAAALGEGGRIEVQDLPEEVARGDRVALPAGSTLEEIERAAILAALEENGGNQARTAAQLGIGTATLYRRLRRWRQERAPAPDERQAPLARG
jgi:DNA-binding NtrC family response regulator